MSEYTQKTADELADMALLEEKLNNDEKIVDKIGEVLGASSQTLEESFMTSIRVRRAERRARKMLAESAEKRANPAQPDDAEDVQTAIQ